MSGKRNASYSPDQVRSEKAESKSKGMCLANLVAKANVVACPSAKLEKVFPPSTPAAEAYGGYGHNYVYLGYLLESERVKTVQVTKPTETCMNGDGLDPALGLMW